MMKSEQFVSGNPYVQAQTAHLSEVRRGTVVENFVSGTIAEAREPVDPNQSRVRVFYRDTRGPRIRYATWWARHVRVIPPDDDEN